jgi:hypothetical protein
VREINNFPFATPKPTALQRIGHASPTPAAMPGAAHQDEGFLRGVGVSRRDCSFATAAALKLAASTVRRVAMGSSSYLPVRFSMAWMTSRLFITHVRLSNPNLAQASM